jgi:hypothetical protein
MKLLAALLLASVSVPSTAFAAPTADPITLTMSMRGSRVGKDKKKTTFPVLDGDSLKTGDDVVMHVSVNQPAYVYVVQFYGDGTSAVLFPQECPTDKPRPPEGCGDVVAQPGKLLRVPEGTDWFTLDENTGTEHVYFLASREPIAKADKAIAGLIDNIRRTNVEAPPPPPERKTKPPVEPTNKVAPVEPTKKAMPAVGAPAKKVSPAPMLTMTTRKLKRVKRDDGQPATEGEAESRDAGLVVLRFSIKHE